MRGRRRVGGGGGRGGSGSVNELIHKLTNSYPEPCNCKQNRTHSAGRPDLAATSAGTLSCGTVVVATRNFVVAGGHARKTVVAGGLDDADGGSKKNKRSGQLH